MANFSGSFSRGAYDSRGFSTTVVYSGYTDAANNQSFITVELKLTSTNNNFSSWTLSGDIVVNSGGADVEILGLANQQFTLAKNSVLSLGSNTRSTTHNADGTKYFDTYGLVDAVTDATYVPNNTRAPLSGTYRIQFPNIYTITYDANGGSVGTSSVKSADGDSVTLPTPSRSGYTFDGWYNGGSSVGGSGSSYTTTSTATLTATWTIDTPAPVFSDPVTNYGTVRVGQPFGDYLSASNATSYSLISAPSGLYVQDYGSYAFISGSIDATSSGSSSITVRASGPGGDTDSSDTFIIKQALPVWTDSTLSNARVGSSYTSGNTFSASGATNWVVSGIPTGLSGSGTSTSTITISGTPTSSGSFTIYATPYNSDGDAGSQVAISLYISPRVPVWVDTTLTTSAQVGVAYSSTVSASYVTSWNDGTLPLLGLAFSGTTSATSTGVGTVSGTPTNYGTASFSITPSNSDAENPGATAFSITVIDAALSWSDQILTSSVATQDTAFSDGVSVQSGPVSVTYSVTPGFSLPTGLSVDPNTGAITGTPTVPGTYSFKIRATNGSSEVLDTSAMSLVIEAAGGYLQVKTAGGWQNAVSYVKTAGGWVEGTVNAKSGTGWDASFTS